MMETSRKVKSALGLIVVLIMIVSVYVAFKSSEGLPLRERSYAKAAFSDAGALRVGNEVRVNQRNVGRVDSIDLVDGQAVVTMQFDQPRTVFRDGTAQILSRSGLGQVYVDVRTGDPSSGELAAEDPLPVAQTKAYTQLTDLITELDPGTRKSWTSAVRELGSGSAGHGKDLDDLLSGAPEMLTDLGNVSQSLVANDGDFASMLSSLDRLSARFEGREQQISTLVGRLGRTFQAVAVDNGEPLRAGLDAAPSTQKDLRSALSSLDNPLDDTGAAMRSLASGSKSLGDATGDVRGFLRESGDPLGKVERFSDSAQPAFGALTQVMHDARPVAPMITHAFDSAQTPLTVLAPYAPEIAKWFSYATSALGDGDTAGHWLRFTLVPATDAVTTNLPVADPLTNSDPHPEPGEAPTQRAPQGPLGGPAGVLQGGNR